VLDFDLFAWLDGASPWWWIALALGLGAVEMVTFTYFMLWLGLAAFTVGIALAAIPSMSGSTQLLIFAILSILYTAAGYYWVSRRQADEPEVSLNRRGAAVIGRQGIVEDAFKAGIGVIEVDGIRWRARLAESTPPPEPGATVRVTAAEGMTVVVEPVG